MLALSQMRGSQADMHLQTRWKRPIQLVYNCEQATSKQRIECLTQATVEGTDGGKRQLLGWIPSMNVDIISGILLKVVAIGN